MLNLFKKTKTYTDLYSEDFEREINKNNNAVLLDVRTAEEFKFEKIPGAINMDVLRPDFNAKVAKLDKGKDYFVYCRSGNRSGHACGILASNGLHCFNLAGGIMSWRGEILERGKI